MTEISAMKVGTKPNLDRILERVCRHPQYMALGPVAGSPKQGMEQANSATHHDPENEEQGQNQGQDDWDGTDRTPTDTVNNEKDEMVFSIVRRSAKDDNTDKLL